MQANTLGRQLELSLGHYLPTVLGAVLVLIIGLISALFVRGVIRTGMTRLRINERVNTQTSSQLDIVRIAASIGFVIYSALVDNWVFIVTNSLILLTAIVGFVLQRRRQGAAARTQRDT